MSTSGKKGRIRGFFSDFKTFISKGNILDMAVGVIIGGAFGKIVTSLVNDIIMPIITLAVGGKSVEDWKWVIKAATEETAESAVNYGLFLQSIIDFLIIAFFIFLALRIIMNFKLRLKKEEEGNVLLSKTERKALKKQYLQQGKTKAEVEVLLDKKEEELTARAQEEARIAQEEAAKLAPAPETTDDILKDIRELLKQSVVTKED